MDISNRWGNALVCYTLSKSSNSVLLQLSNYVNYYEQFPFYAF